jgi:hypothetical protein
VWPAHLHVDQPAARLQGAEGLRHALPRNKVLVVPRQRLIICSEQISSLVKLSMKANTGGRPQCSPVDHCRCRNPEAAAGTALDATCHKHVAPPSSKMGSRGSPGPSVHGPSSRAS